MVPSMPTPLDVTLLRGVRRLVMSELMPVCKFTGRGDRQLLNDCKPCDRVFSFDDAVFDDGVLSSCMWSYLQHSYNIQWSGARLL